MVHWTAPASPGDAVTSYTVTPYIGSTAQGSLAVVVTTVYGSGVVTTANVGGLADGSRYTFQVTATNAVGTGPPGTSGPGTPAPSAPVTLTPGTGYDSGSTPQWVAVGDLAGNGWPDIVTANGSGFSVSTLRNQLSGGGRAGGRFAQPATISSATGTLTQAAFGDFNKDGKLDAAVLHDSPSIAVMLGNGDGSFQAESGTQTLPNSDFANVIAVADVNGDGNLDIVVGINQGGYPNETGVAVLFGDGHGGFSTPVEYWLPNTGGGNATGVAVADLNGDGHPDIVEADDNPYVGSDRGEVWVLLNDGDGTFSVPSGNIATIPGLGNLGALETVAVTDLNGDGVPDIVAITRGSNDGVALLLGKGDGTFQPKVIINDPTLTDGNPGGEVVALATADMNGDGLPDLVTADQMFNGTGGISVYLNPGSGTMDLPTFIATSSFSPQTLALADVNGDVEPDVVLENGRATGQNVPANVEVLLNGTDFPPLGGALGPNEMHGCVMCQALRGGGALDVSGKYPITVNSGEMSHTFSDISVPARGYPLAITQTYNDLNAGTDAGLGYGWWSPLFMSVSQDSGTGITTVTQEDGAQAQFWSSTLQPLAPRTQASLVHNGDGSWTFTRNRRDTFIFNASGQITAMADITGDRLSFGYSGGEVTSLSHSDGRSLAIAWSNGHISSITDANVSGMSRTVVFTYDGSNELTDIDWLVNGGNDRNEHFEYDSSNWSHGLTGMRDPRGVWVTQVYDSAGHTLSQTVDPTSKDPSGLNRTTTYSYTMTDGLITQVLITDPAGREQLDSFAYGELVQKVAGLRHTRSGDMVVRVRPQQPGHADHHRPRRAHLDRQLRQLRQPPGDHGRAGPGHLLHLQRRRRAVQPAEHGHRRQRGDYDLQLRHHLPHPDPDLDAFAGL